MSIAATIAKQIGNRTLTLIGAHDLVDGGDYLGIHTGRGLLNKITVTLEGDDTYTVRRHRISRDYTTFYERVIAEGVYCEQLAEIIATA